MAETKGAFLLALGNQAFARGQYSQALRLFSQSLEEDPFDIICLCNRSAACLKLELFKKALADAEAALELDESFSKAWLRKAQALHGQGKLESSKRALQKLLEFGGDLDDFMFGQLCLQGKAEVDESRSQHAGIPGPPPQKPARVPSQSHVSQKNAASSEPESSKTGQAVRTPAKENPSNTALKMPAPAPASAPQVVSETSPARSPHKKHASKSSLAGSSPSQQAKPQQQQQQQQSTKARQSSSSAVRDSAHAASSSASAASGSRSSGPVVMPAGATRNKTIQAQGGRSDNEGLSISAAGANVSSSDPQVAMALQAVQQVLDSGENLDDKQRISIGFLLVNTGNYDKGIEQFNKVLRASPKCLEALLGRGTAFALCNRLPLAIKDFSTAIELDPSCADAWKRRGQTRAAVGEDDKALTDLAQAIRLSKDYESFHQRGIVLHKMQDFRTALKDFKEAVRLDAKHPVTWNFYGLCENSLGNVKPAIAAYNKALAIDPNFKEGWVNLAQAYRDFGDEPNSIKYFAQALEVDPSYIHALHLRGLFWYGVGKIHLALKDFSKAVQLNSAEANCVYMKGVSEMALGQWSSAVRSFDNMLVLDSDHVCFYQREIALYMIKRADDQISTFNFDVQLDQYMKEAWCKRHSIKHPRMRRYKKFLPPRGAIKDVDSKMFSQNSDFSKIFDASIPIGRLIQLNTPGFLSNRRQHRMVGFSVLEMAQALRSHWNALKQGNKYDFDSRGASKQNGKPHAFGWRDFMDISVRWRQVSEPNDQVFWIDLLAPEAFSEGFGLQTPMVTGQMDVVRYFPYAGMAIEAIKKHAPKHGVCDVRDNKFKLPAPQLALLEKVTNCDEMMRAVGQPFYLETPCQSLAVKGRTFSGTRITLLQKPPGGYEFTIRTPGTPPRWVLYDEELNVLWDRINDFITSGSDDTQEFHTLVFTFYFYWCNFGPLSRGTAACGFIALLAMLIAHEECLVTSIPEGVQVDWPAILTTHPEQFMGIVYPWFRDGIVKKDVLDGLPNVRDVISTPRQMIAALNSSVLRIQ